MICPPCREAAKMWSAGDGTGRLLYEVDSLHGLCEYGETCTCQHHLLDKPISP